MLNSYLRNRKFEDTRRMASVQALTAGMVNVSSVIVFFAFTSNITGHFAILAQELSKGNWYQAAVAIIWLSMFFVGNFSANLFLVLPIGRLKRKHRAVIPVVLEVICLLLIATYIQLFYRETLGETEFLVGFLLFTMGLQNGQSAGLSNFAIKTTHLTGLMTDLGVMLAMFIKKENRRNPNLVERCRLSFRIMGSYLLGGIIGGIFYRFVGASLFYIVSLLLLSALAYPFVRASLTQLILNRQLQADRRMIRARKIGKSILIENTVQAA